MKLGNARICIMPLKLCNMKGISMRSFSGVGETYLEQIAQEQRHEEQGNLGLEHSILPHILNVVESSLD